MIKYHKINTIFKRDKETKKLLIDEYSLPEFEYLANNEWEWTEKMDGTNCRIHFDLFSDTINFGGRTDNAIMQMHLLRKLQDIFTLEKLKTIFKENKILDIIFFGEGVGYKIQEPYGKLYNPTDAEFILFDVLMGRGWLKREDVNKLAETLEIKSAPIVGKGTLSEAVDFVKSEFTSTFGNFKAEGLVLRPKEELYSRARNRIIAKLKHKDFKKD